VNGTNTVKPRALRPIGLFVVASAVAAVALALGAPSWLQTMVRVVASYDAGVIAMLLWYLHTVLRSSAGHTRDAAATEDPGRDAALVLTLTAVAFGFVAAFSILARAPHDRIAEHEVLAYSLGFAAVLLGWLLIHTILLFRYAHLYYRDRDHDKESDRGLTFPGDPQPNYLDFAYFSFVVGMTFQVSDVQVTSKGIRKLVLAHGLVSFAYNTAILALVVNVVSGLLH
jgi:uncharacterized membrane protein